MNPPETNPLRLMYPEIPLKFKEALLENHGAIFLPNPPGRYPHYSTVIDFFNYAYKEKYPSRRPRTFLARYMEANPVESFALITDFLFFENGLWFKQHSRTSEIHNNLEISAEYNLPYVQNFMPNFVRTKSDVPYGEKLSGFGYNRSLDSNNALLFYLTPAIHTPPSSPKRLRVSPPEPMRGPFY